jgi:NADH:ubiquinone oxidoreductase subunit C
LFEKNLLLPQLVTLRMIQDAMSYAQAECPATIHSTRVTPEGIILRTTPKKLRALAVYLRSSTMYLFTAITEIAVVDRLLPAGRFVVNYHLLSRMLNQRVVIQLAVSETEDIPSITLPAFKREITLFPAAG